LRPRIHTFPALALAILTSLAVTAPPAAADGPVAHDDTYSVAEDGSLTIDSPGVLGNDEGAPTTAVLDTGTASGTLDLGDGGSFTYTPDPNFTGDDSFTYHANDGAVDSAVATVTITVTPVNDDPVAVGDAATTAEDTPSDPIAVLANDTDADGDTLSLVSVGQPAHGAATDNGDGTVSYTPEADFNGADSFTYTVSDGNGGTDVGTVNVTTTAVNDPPMAADDSFGVDENQQLVVSGPGVLANDTDVDDVLLASLLEAGPSHGSLDFDANGGFTYRPDTGFHGQDSFTYRAADGSAQSAPATVTITVTNQPPAASQDAYSVDEDSTLSANAGLGVLSNDADPENDEMTATLVSGPAHGTLDLQPDGSFTYTPDPNFDQADSFTYHPHDGISDGTSATATITVQGSEDPPVAADDAKSTAEDTPVQVAVLSNDADPDTGDTLSVTGVADVPPGATAVPQPNGSVLYTPPPNANGAQSFTYTASDGHGGSDQASVTVTVTPVQDGPAAAGDSGTVNRTAPGAPGWAEVTVLANDTDPDAGDVLRVASFTQGTFGTVARKGGAPNVLVYTPGPAVCNRSDSFTYVLGDGHGHTATATVQITVATPKARPSLSLAASTAALGFGSPVTITATLGRSIPASRIEISRTPFGGSKTIAGTGTGSKAHVTLRPPVATTFSARSLGDNCYLPAQSRSVAVAVRARTTGAMVEASKIVKGVRVYGSGKTPLYRGRVAPNHGGQNVTFEWQRQQGHAWKSFFTGSFPLNGDSTIAEFLSSGAVQGVLYRVRIVWPGGSGNLRSAAPWSLFRVSG
jgi:VCBS repeat-containing protein